MTKQQTDKHSIGSRKFGHERLMILRRNPGGTITESPMTSFHLILMFKSSETAKIIHIQLV